MKKVQKREIMFLLVCTFVITFMSGCGVPHIRTIKELTDISNYRNVYVANTEVSSKEQTNVAKSLNEEFSKYAKDKMISALKKKGGYSVLGDISQTTNTLIIQTTISIVYGSRAQRYWTGHGSGSVVINVKLNDSLSSETKLEIEARSKLYVGFYGGSMNKVVKDSIKKVVKEFIVKL